MKSIVTAVLCLGISSFVGCNETNQTEDASHQGLDLRKSEDQLIAKVNKWESKINNETHNAEIWNSENDWKDLNSSGNTTQPTKQGFLIKRQLTTPEPLTQYLTNATDNFKNEILEQQSEWAPIIGRPANPTAVSEVDDSLKFENNWAASYVQSAHHDHQAALAPHTFPTEQEEPQTESPQFALPHFPQQIVKYPVFIHLKQPFPVHVKVPQPYPVEVKVPVPVHVKVPEPYPVIKKVPYVVKQFVYVSKPYPVEKPVYHTVKVPIHKYVPYPVYKPYPVHVQKKIFVPYIIKKPFPVKIYVEKPIPVHVEKKIPYPVKVPYGVPYPVIKNVPYPVYKKVIYPVQVPVEKPISYKGKKEVSVPAESKVPYFVHHYFPFPKRTTN